MTESLPTVQITPSGHQFDCPPGSTILSAGLGAGFALPFACANGSCGSCLARVVDGEIEAVRFHDYTLTQAQKLSGHFLMCSCAPRGSAVVEVAEASSVHDMPEQTLKAKRCQIFTQHDVIIIRFKFTRGKAFRFLPGQLCELHFDDGFSKRLSIASCPCDAQTVEFHLPQNDANGSDVETSNADDDFNGRIRELSRNERVVIKGPTGSFTLSDDFSAAKVFVAIGEGFASIQGLIEHVINLDLESRCLLIWQATSSTGHYFDNLCRSWADALDEFRYRPISAHENAAETIAAELNQMPGSTEVYLSGPSWSDSSLDPGSGSKADNVTALAAELENSGITRVFVNHN